MHRIPDAVSPGPSPMLGRGLSFDAPYASHLPSGRPCPAGSGAISDAARPVGSAVPISSEALPNVLGKRVTIVRSHVRARWIHAVAPSCRVSHRLRHRRDDPLAAVRSCPPPQRRASSSSKSRRHWILVAGGKQCCDEDLHFGSSAIVSSGSAPQPTAAFSSAVTIMLPAGASSGWSRCFPLPGLS